MKTTVDLPDALVREAQDVARAEGTTLRALLEDGLRAVLARRRSATRFELPDASVGGKGVRPELRGAGWDDLLAASYGDRT
ncbi:type II toxin-antitoxin system VapB family antitoxin [Pseudofrankia sp. DC12]|uniref:type II toxin-antitoxin system VapB family antitoxin n=1 Tax=Pseudofrankia sp. DC12 TaxID=683315 RepID=UPI001E329BE6|nr:type II toxin-antitoxin system VapB family antitoxin [Pseudofrankia sp. DC12]